jgi:hypothetical protein
MFRYAQSTGSGRRRPRDHAGCEVDCGDVGAAASGAGRDGPQSTADVEDALAWARVEPINEPPVDGRVGVLAQLVAAVAPPLAGNRVCRTRASGDPQRGGFGCAGVVRVVGRRRGQPVGAGREPPAV